MQTQEMNVETPEIVKEFALRAYEDTFITWCLPQVNYMQLALASTCV